jgi:hypothetical protein
MEIKDLVGIALIFVTVAITIAIGLSVQRTVQTDQATNTAGNFFENKTFTPKSIASTVTVGNAGTTGECSIDTTKCVIYNASDGDILSSKNYTLTATSCTATVLIDEKIQNTSAKNLSCPYTYKDGYAYNISRQGQMGVSTFGTWLPTLALILVAALILGVLISHLVGRFKD